MRTNGCVEVVGIGSSVRVRGGFGADGQRRRRDLSRVAQQIVEDPQLPGTANRLAANADKAEAVGVGAGSGMALDPPLEHDARFAVLVNGDDKYQALKRPWMEALVRAGGCAVVDHTRIDAALQQRLAHSPTSAPVLQEVSRAAGATMVFMLDQKTGMAHLIEVATAEVPMQWPIDE